MIGPQQISRLVLPPLPPEANPGATVGRTPDARLRDMAREFETTLLSMLLKEMRQTLDEDGGFFPGDKGDVQGGLFDLFMSRHLAEAGGVGLADAIVRQMQPASATTTHDPARSARGIPRAAPPG